MTTIENITDKQIETLAAEARTHGDYMQAMLCELALGDENYADEAWLNDNVTALSPAERRELANYTVEMARGACVDAINAAEAML